MGNTGWICPKCGKVHAPWVPSCECNNTSLQYGINTSDINTNGIDKMKFVTTCSTSENLGQDLQMILD